MHGLYVLWWVQQKHVSVAAVAAILAAGDLFVTVLELPTGFIKSAGAPLDPQRAENLAAQCAELLKSVTDTRNTLRVAAESHGVN
jgi:hypothetical protein